MQSQRVAVETVSHGVVHLLAIHDGGMGYRAYRVCVPVPGTLPDVQTQTAAEGARGRKYRLTPFAGGGKICVW